MPNFLSFDFNRGPGLRMLSEVAGEQNREKHDWRLMNPLGS